MDVPIEFLRGVLGVIAIGCAYMAGRTLVSVRKGWVKPQRIYGWIIRLVLCLAAVAFRHSLDVVDIVVVVLAAAAFSLAYWDMSREKKTEDLSRTIFPDQR